MRTKKTKSHKVKAAYCVISPNVGSYTSSSGRRWFMDYAKAAEYARGLLNRRKPGSLPCIVVKAIRVFEVQPTPVVERDFAFDTDALQQEPASKGESHDPR